MLNKNNLFQMDSQHSQSQSNFFDSLTPNYFIFPINPDSVQQSNYWRYQQEKDDLSQLQQGQKQASNGSSTERKKKSYSKAPTKNILKNCRSYYQTYFEEYFPNAKDDDFLKKFFSAKTINKQDYENMFKIQRFKGILSKMFEQRYLQRRIQLSRAQFSEKIQHMKKIRVFKKAFQMEWFPKLNA